MSYEERLKIPIIGNDELEFYTLDETLIAKGYLRIVIGGRGPYIEFTEDQINWDNTFIPDTQEWRKDSTNAFYIEHRTTDKANVKIYEQKKLVDYADYKIGLFYISPFDLCTKDGRIIEPLRKK